MTKSPVIICVETRPVGLSKEAAVVLSGSKGRSKVPFRLKAESR